MVIRSFHYLVNDLLYSLFYMIIIFIGATILSLDLSKQFILYVIGNKKFAPKWQFAWKRFEAWSVNETLEIDSCLKSGYIEIWNIETITNAFFVHLEGFQIFSYPFYQLHEMTHSVSEVPLKQLYLCYHKSKKLCITWDGIIYLGKWTWHKCHRSRSFEIFFVLSFLSILFSLVFSSKIKIPFSQKDPVHPASQPSSHWPVTWLQVELSLQLPSHGWLQFSPYHPFPHANHQKNAIPKYLFKIV